jgi:hypothetical protein
VTLLRPGTRPTAILAQRPEAGGTAAVHQADAFARTDLGVPSGGRTPTVAAVLELVVPLNVSAEVRACLDRMNSWAGALDAGVVHP